MNVDFESMTIEEIFLQEAGITTQEEYDAMLEAMAN